MPQDQGVRVRLSDYAPPPYLVDTVDLAFDLEAERTLVEARLLVRRSAHAPVGAPFRLDGEGLTLLSAALDGAPIGRPRLEPVDGGLSLSDPPDSFELITRCLIQPRANRSRSGLLEIGGALITQCEPEGFRKLTYFPDRPDVLARYEVTLRADPEAYPVLLSNGDLVGEGSLEDGRRWTRWRDPYPKPSYIFAIVAGRFDCVSRRRRGPSGREVVVSVWAEPALTPRCRFALDAAVRSLEWDEATYGLEYDLSVYNIVAVTGWSGAMENKGLSIFGASGIVADPEIATDDDYIVIERIVGHEQFHNWTGNRVTCRDWFQLCLKEGLTRFRDQHFIEDRLGSGVWRIESVKQLRRNQFPEDDGPAAHPVKPDAYAEIENFYTNTVYDKGAEVVRMLRTLLGPDAFRAGFDLYIERHDGQAVTTEDFIAAMEAASGRDLSQFLAWQTEAGRPRVSVRTRYDAAARRLHLEIRQTCAPTPGQPVKPAFLIPLAIGLLDEAGRPLSFRPAGGPATTQTVLELAAPEARFVFEAVERRPIPSLLRGFSAPVTLKTDLSQEDLAVLAAFDPDPFARWDAAQTLLIGAIRDNAAAAGATPFPACVFDAVGRAIGGAFEGEGGAPGEALLRGLILITPDEPALSEGLDEIDLDALMAARRRLREGLAARFGAALRQLYDSLAERGPYAPDIEGVGRRKLKNAALDLLAAAGSSEGASLVLEAMTQAANMTDAFEALCLLTHLDGPERQAGIDAFYDRWRLHPTVIDKWFNAQALSRCAGAVDKIIALEGHPAFDPANFSQALAYYGGFFRQNRVAFHDPSGRGYDFLVDRLLTMDQMGRSGSHYLMPQLNQWRRYDPHRRALMRRALERLAGAPSLSKGLRENVERALGPSPD